MTHAPDVSADSSGPINKPKGAWDALGLCRDETLGTQFERRSRQLIAFLPRTINGVQVYMDPNMSESRLGAVVRALERSKRVAESHLGMRTQTPDLFVYADLAALQNWSCVHRSAVAYYDGAIHVAIQRDWETSLTHEYVHHTLTTAGILEPMWFHEGTAMFLADEKWWESAWYAGTIDATVSFGDMIAPHVHGTSEDQALAYYGEARLMVAFLWEMHGEQQRDQVAALEDERLTGRPVRLVRAARRSAAPARLRRVRQNARRIDPLRVWDQQHVAPQRQQFLQRLFRTF